MSAVVVEIPDQEAEKDQKLKKITRIKQLQLSEIEQCHFFFVTQS